MDNPKIFIFAEPDGAAECNAKLESYSCDLTVGSADWHSPQGNNEDEMIGLARDAQALLGTSIRSSPITRKIMEASPELRVVAKCTVGTDDVDVEAATELGILVCHAPTESNCYGVAEGTVAFILASVKKLSQRDAQVKDGKWRDPNLMGSYLGRRSTESAPASRSYSPRGGCGSSPAILISATNALSVTASKKSILIRCWPRPIS